LGLPREYAFFIFHNNQAVRRTSAFPPVPASAQSSLLGDLRKRGV